MTAGVLGLPIDAIGELDPEDYVGLIDEDAVACLSARLAAEGLHTPIWVRRNGNAAPKRWSVVCGRHRLLAATKLGWTEINAEERADPSSTREELRRLQVVENLDRRDLRPIERARFVMERWREAAARIVPSVAANQQSQAIRMRWTAWEAISHTPESNRRAVDEATAADCGGKTDRWVRIYRRLYETIIVPFPDLVEALNAHQLGASLSAMNRIATIRNEASRLKGIKSVLSRPEWQSIDEALGEVGIGGDRGFRVDADVPDMVTLAGWRKLKGPTKQATFLAMAKDVPPSWLQAAVKADPRIARDRRSAGKSAA